MQINGSEVISYNKDTGVCTCADGSEWYLSPSLNITFYGTDNSKKESGLEYAKAGYSAEDLMRLKACGVI